MTELTGLTWDRVDELVEELAQDAVEAQSLVDSGVLIFREGVLAYLLSTPPFLVETADRITEVLCRFLPRFDASHVAIVWPLALEDPEDGDLHLGMKVHRYDRSSPTPFVTYVRPLPVHGSCDGHTPETGPPLHLAN